MKSQHPKIVSAESVYEGKLVSVKRVRAIFGNEEVLREVVEHPGSVAVVGRDEEDRFLLVSQFRMAVGETTLEIPAGTLERGEDPAHCAYREFEEETGYRAVDLRLLAETYTTPGYTSEKLYIFSAKARSGSGPRWEPDENIRLVRMSRDEVLAAIQRKEIRDLKSIAALLFAIYLGG